MKFPWRDFLLICLIACLSRGLLLASESVSFHSDEAVVALMARHINEGQRPTFFYGQAYMGSLDAWLVALGFQLFGESVSTIRLVQSVLYLLVVATGYLVAWRFSGRRVIAASVGLLLAIPAVNTALYTTATLGGYNETLLFGNLILLLSYSVTHEHGTSLWRWALLGFIAGVAWWVNGLIIMTIAPVGLLALWIWWRERRPLRHIIPGLLAGLIGLVAGSAPWWVYDFTHDHAALATYLTNRQSGLFEGIGLPYVPPSQRALGLGLIGIPTLLGLKFPWAGEFYLPAVGIIILLIYAAAIWHVTRRPDLLRPHVGLLILLFLTVFGMVFVLSTFGADPTGRYFLPLVLPLSLCVGALLQSLWDQGHMLQRSTLIAVLLVISGYHASGQIVAARSVVGFTTQFDLISHVPNSHDAELIAFLTEQQLYHGYTNYWVAFRLAFLSQETLQYSARLPYKEDLSYNAADNRYPPYVTATETADSVAYITTNLPQLDTYLQDSFRQQQVIYQQKVIGPYHIYYDFKPHAPSLAPGDMPITP